MNPRCNSVVPSRLAVLFVSLFIMFIPGTSRAADFHVPGDFPTIQAAIDSASKGDRVLVAPGTYSGAGNVGLDFMGKAITLQSEGMDPATCTIDCNSGRGITFHSGEGAGTVVKGLTITDGLASGDGGAMRIAGASPTIQNCNLSGNWIASGGSAVHILSGSPVFEDCTLSDNSDAILMDAGAQITLRRCSFNADNRCLIAWQNTQVNFEDCLVSNSWVGFTFWGSQVYGTRSTFRGVWGSPFDVAGPGTLRLDDSLFLRNQHGVGAYTSYLGEINRCTFDGNVDNGVITAFSTGGARVRDCIFFRNGIGAEAYTGGGPVQVINCLFVANGIGLYGKGGPAIVAVNCTATANLNAGIQQKSGPATVTNCILWANGGPDLDGCSATYSDIGTGSTAGAGNASWDPRFVRAPSPGPDSTWGTADDDIGDLHLVPSSPCIDGGTGSATLLPDKDLDGNARALGAGPDMGAYEQVLGGPRANAGPDQTLTVPHDGDPSTQLASISLDGSYSFGDSLSFEWSEGGVAFATTAAANLDRPAGTYVFSLKVMEPDGDTSTDTVQVTVLSEPNRPPKPNAGPDQTIGAPAGAEATLDGGGTSDPDGDTLAYSWTEGGVEVATGVSAKIFLGVGTHTLTLTVTDPYGSFASDTVTIRITTDVFTVQLDRLSKSSAYAGEFTPTLTGFGGGFKPGAVIMWNGNPLPTTFYTSNQVRTVLSSEQVAEAGVFDVQVKNPDSGLSNPLPFTVLNRQPAITGVYPEVVAHGSGGFTLEINGARFVRSSVVTWNGAERETTYLSPTRLTIAVTAADIVNPGRVILKVVNPAPGGGVTEGKRLTIQ